MPYIVLYVVEWGRVTAKTRVKINPARDIMAKIKDSVFNALVLIIFFASKHNLILEMKENNRGYAFDKYSLLFLHKIDKLITRPTRRQKEWHGRAVPKTSK